VAIQQTAAVPKKPLVGLNYPVPWNAYGIYFGGGNPPASFPALDAWTVNLKQNLIQLRDTLNIRVVRIFLLGNASNYGASVGGVFTPPTALHPKFIDHLQKMFLAFRDTSMLVIPSLIDFKAFGHSVVLTPAVLAQPAVMQEGSIITPAVKAKGVVTNGCNDMQAIVRDSTIRDLFFKQTLEPFLQASIPFQTSIYAWEVQNEPYWNVQNIVNRFAPLKIAGGFTVEASESSTFLQQGVDLIADTHKFPSTVGHRFSDDLDNFPTGTRRQFHFYPLLHGLPLTQRQVIIADRHLPHFNDTKAFIGEFGIQDPSDGHGALWDDLNGADAPNTRVRVLERLKLIRAQEYPLALIWPDGMDGHGSVSSAIPGPDPIQLSPAAIQGIQDFMKLP